MEDIVPWSGYGKKGPSKGGEAEDEDGPLDKFMAKTPATVIMNEDGTMVAGDGDDEEDEEDI